MHQAKSDIDSVSAQSALRSASQLQGYSGTSVAPVPTAILDQTGIVPYTLGQPAQSRSPTSFLQSAGPTTTNIGQLSHTAYSTPNPQVSGRQITQFTQYTELNQNPNPNSDPNQNRTQNRKQLTNPLPQSSQPYNARQGSVPPPYESADTKMSDGGNSGGSQPSTTGTVGFSRYRTAGPPGLPKQQYRGNR